MTSGAERGEAVPEADAPGSPGDVRSRSWQNLTSEEIRTRVDARTVAVMPLGAVEQHGPHLPLSTDVDIAVGILEEAFRILSPTVPALSLPPLPLGASPEHLDLPGTLSVEPELLARVLVEVGRSLARHGVRRLVAFSAHGGNRAALETAGLRLRREKALLVVGTSHFALPRPPDVELPDDEWRHGLHGGAVETAMMLHLHPDRVRRDAIDDFPSLGRELEEELEVVAPTGPAPFSWLATDLNPAGVTGDATRASARMGARLVGHYAALLASVIRDAAAFPLERLSTSRPGPPAGSEADPTPGPEPGGPG